MLPSVLGSPFLTSLRVASRIPGAYDLQIDNRRGFRSQRLKPLKFVRSGLPAISAQETFETPSFGWYFSRVLHSRTP